MIRIFMDSKSSQFKNRQNSIKNIKYIDSRWVVETTAQICEISGGEEILWVWFKMADRDIQVFYPLDSCNILI